MDSETMVTRSQVSMLHDLIEFRSTFTGDDYIVAWYDAGGQFWSAVVAESEYPRLVRRLFDEWANRKKWHTN